jgi:hypothetical protein
MHLLNFRKLIAVERPCGNYHEINIAFLRMKIIKRNRTSEIYSFNVRNVFKLFDKVVNDYIDLS